ncbi:hypothetical protein FNJ88_07490 [Chryseobacterium sp. SNU WT5]|uniref:M56 family metallopeptidase n=1 Tax=Chryseobacterium sp. SNU WT5 TaxID=2594269 RepID=UPI00117FFFBA|nr:M56 family metallopeptidase [Chryseobacterium sp. SNU WT5]QDP85410.1 hypothetical protein FNJ88_07490 [Chryseobacterium sp. SNU WT5]
METLILKILISSCLLIGFYYVFLEKDRTFKFNRVFLLTTLLFAYAVPFIPFGSRLKTIGESNLLIGNPLPIIPQLNGSESTSVDWVRILIIAYLLVSALFLIKFIYAIAKIKFVKGEQRRLGDQKVMIIEKDYAPFSFLSTMYFNKKYFINDQIDDRIFLHEKCHIQEKHSADILFVEFLKILSWFNPALFFYKKAMVANHEFLADDYVLRRNHDIRNYQHLILKEIKFSQHFNLTHQFDFNNTKKRFIMMTSKNSRFTTLKKIALLPVLVILFVSFTKKSTGQNNSENDKRTSFIKQVKESSIIPTIAKKNDDTDLLSIIAKRTVENLAVSADTVRTKVKQAEVAPAPVAPPKPVEAQGETVDILPEFPGGINAFRSLLASKFNTAIFKGDEGLIKATVYTNIDENGKMTDIFAEGTNQNFNREAERALTMISADHVWIPAKLHGKPVKYRFKLPLTMKFEGPAVRK